jgi:uncharacterized Rossmann fold enzyme
MDNEQKLKATEELVEHARQIRIIVDHLFGDNWEKRYAARAVVVRYILERAMTQVGAKEALLLLGRNTWE